MPLMHEIDLATSKALLSQCQKDFGKQAKRTAELEAEIAQLRAKLAGECRDAAFYKCCALSGEIPSPGSEPSARDKALTEGEIDE